MSKCAGKETRKEYCRNNSTPREAKSATFQRIDKNSRDCETARLKVLVRSVTRGGERLTWLESAKTGTERDMNKRIRAR